MLLAQWPVSVVMQRHTDDSRWQQTHWSALAVLPRRAHEAGAGDEDEDTACWRTLGGLQRHGGDPARRHDRATHVARLVLELHSDELDGYFENWAAPFPKVFVAWHLCQEPGGQVAVPVQVSVSYAEGARMLDAAEGAAGVEMSRELHDWLGICLAVHRPARPVRGHGQRHT